MPTIKSEHSANVTIGHGQLDTVMNWCRNSFESDWHITEIRVDDSNRTVYQFKFNSERDLLLFELKWG